MSPEGPAYLDLPPNHSSGLHRSKTTAQTGPKTAGSRSSTSTVSRTPQSSRFGSHFTQAAAWNDNNDNSSNSIEEADEDADEDYQEWGLSKGMELFEVSAKDDIGQIYYLRLTNIVS